MRVALFEPEIAGNVGAVLRLGACLGTPVDLIEPGIARLAAAERAMDRVGSRFGRDSVIRGKLYGRRKSNRDYKIKEGEPK